MAVMLNRSEAQTVTTEVGEIVTAEGGEAAKGTRKRKADQLETSTRKQPAAPECPVREKSHAITCSLLISLLQVCFDKMEPPTRIFQCGNGYHICGTCR